MSQTNSINLDDCWLWASGVTSWDYGMAGNQYAHRLFYEIYKGEIPHKYQIDHLCFVPRCVNPEHLEAVTELENIRRSWAKRAVTRKNNCPNGHPYSGDNVRLEHYKGGIPGRRCVTCKRIQSKRAGERRKLKRDLSKS